ncbi:MAG: patatin-like phospholipase family protein [Acidimicrobiia bacterium]|jgi:NTE family protein
MTTAFVLSGGASLGAVQVGMLHALADRGIRPDLVFGSSAGAINAAWVAGDPQLDHVDDLAKIWIALRSREIFPVRPLTGLLGFLGRRDSLVPPTGLRRLLERHVTFARLEDAPIPVAVIATEVTTGREVVLQRGSTVDAVLASAAIPAVFPPVTIDGRVLMDGGVVNNTPISNAVDAGATRIYVLPTGYACALTRAPMSALGMTLQAISLLIEQQLIRDVDEFQDRVDLRVIPPLCPQTVLPADFSHARELIDRARASAREWLDRFDREGVPPDEEVNLRFHRH